LGQLWIAAVAILICLLVWRDVARTLSGLFYLASSLPQQSGNYAEALDLLDYAAWFDLEAGLAYNQKGYLQFTMGESSSAMTAFAQALSMNKVQRPGPQQSIGALSHDGTGGSIGSQSTAGSRD
jgi:tetratricopeptide (TPR) repeat protein